VPLVMFTSSRAKMGEFVSPTWLKVLAWMTAGLIVMLNVKYLSDYSGLTNWLITLFR